jgi:hypothetical protein
MTTKPTRYYVEYEDLVALEAREAELGAMGMSKEEAVDALPPGSFLKKENFSKLEWAMAFAETIPLGWYAVMERKGIRQERIPGSDLFTWTYDEEEVDF